MRKCSGFPLVEGGRHECGLELLIGLNWSEAREQAGVYRCDSCNRANFKQLNAHRNYKNTKRRLRPVEHPELERIRQERAAAYSKSDEVDQRARDGFVYVIQIPGQDYLKIGHARDPMQRVKSVKSFLVEDPVILHMEYTVDRYELEKDVHQELETYRHPSNKELFDCGEVHAISTVKVCREYQEKVNDDTRMGHRSGWTTSRTDDGLAIDRRGGD